MSGTGLTGPPNATLEPTEINADSSVSWITLTRIERHSMWYRERGREEKMELPGEKKERVKPSLMYGQLTGLL